MVALGDVHLGLYIPVREHFFYKKVTFLLVKHFFCEDGQTNNLHMPVHLNKLAKYFKL